MATGGGKRRAERPSRPPKPAKVESEARSSTRTLERSPQGSRPDRPARPRAGRITRKQALWLIGVFGGAAAIPAINRFTEAPMLVAQIIAAIVGTLLCVGLAIRSGGRWLPIVILCAVVGVAALATQWEPLLAGSAVGTAAVAACLGVLASTPSATFARAILETVLALTIALAGSFAAFGFDSAIEPMRFSYVVLALGLGGSVALVYRLGAGLNGLGRRGYLIAGVALLLLAVALAYTAALRRWGSADMNNMVEAVRSFTRDTFIGVPHPVIALLGVPSLAWGSFMRARRRQGWWVTAFGAAATAPTTVIAFDRSSGALSTGLSLVYSVLIGLVVAYVVARVEQYFNAGSNSPRARRAESDQAHRPEPGRMSPLH